MNKRKRRVKVFSVVTSLALIFQMMMPVLGASFYQAKAAPPMPSPVDDRQECVEGATWVTNVEGFTQGQRMDGSDVLPERSDPSTGLGPDDEVFVSLGFGGEVVYSFMYPVENGDGVDLSIHEMTIGREVYPEETADVYVGMDLGDMRLVGVASSKAVDGVTYLDFDSTGLPWIKYVRIVDTTNTMLFEEIPDADAFDVDAVDGVYGICENYPESGRLQGKKYLDENRNHRPDRGEKFLNDWEIRLYNDDWGLVDTRKTGHNGNKGQYVFDNIPFGTYYVCEVVEAGYTQTAPFKKQTNSSQEPGNTLGYGEAVNNHSPDKKHEAKKCWEVDLDWNNARVNNLKFGNDLKTGDLEICKYVDKNQNGDMDGKDRLRKWSVHVEGMDDVERSEDGCYVWKDIPVGKYRVYEDAKRGWIMATDNNWETVKVRDHKKTTVYFGNYKYGKISGYKFEDLNMNGAWDEGEPTLNGWEICLMNGGRKLAVEAKERCVKTGDKKMGWQDGYYEFNKLNAGEYWVYEDKRDEEGWTQTYPLEPDAHEVHITSGVVRKHQDFGNYKYGRITIFKYNDANHNGEYDKGESGIEWPIYVSRNGSKPKMVWTDEDGYLVLDELEPGTFQIWEGEDNGNGEWEQTDGDGMVEVNVISGTDENIYFGNWEKPKLKVFKFNDLNGDGEWNKKTEPPLEGWEITVCRDYNVLPVEAFDLSSVNFERNPLYKESVSDPFNCMTKTTNANGKAVFRNLEYGRYRVMENMQDGWIQTKPLMNKGRDYYYVNVTRRPEKKVFRRTFGNFKLGKVAGYKWEDMNQNGVWDEGEKGLEGWNIKLCQLDFMKDVRSGSPNKIFSESSFMPDLDCSEEWTTTTDENGYYEFNGLMHGFYVVMEEKQENWDATYPVYGQETENYYLGYPMTIMSGTEFGDREECYGESMNFPPLKKERKVEEIAISLCPNFGNFEYGMIQGRKYRDVNKNGDFDKDERTNENRLDGWNINLYKCEDPSDLVDLASVEEGNCVTEGAEPYKSMLTGDDSTEAGNVAKGQYRFVGLEAGRYLVCETPQDGWRQSEPMEETGIASPENDGTYCFEVNVESGTRATWRQFGNIELMPDLWIEVNDDSDPVAPGDPITYTITYGNKSLGENPDGYRADNVVVTKVVPQYTTFDVGSSTPGWTCMPDENAGSTCSFDVGTLNPGEEGTLTFTVIVDPSITSGSTIIDPATIYYDNGNGKEVTYDNNTAGETTEVEVQGEVLGESTQQSADSNEGEVLGASDELTQSGLFLLYSLVFGVLTVMAVVGSKVLVLKGRNRS